MADGFVTGRISGGGTTASVTATVNCINSAPSGSISGTVSFPSEQFTRRFTFNSSSPFVVATILSSSIESVGAAFDNVTLQEDTFTPITGATAYLNATRINSSVWVGSFEVIAPSGEQLFIYGAFSGTVDVDRQVFCQPLL